ncbi:MAG TPA: hypothetical protein VMW41_00215 [Candidatus Bathyarchaeia archaeon]|nr:hypothetical protein [Candidatus Bathyarchaeia archaeon]
MKIIFEGPDGSGKTTAINYIQKMTSWDKVVSGGPLLCRDDLKKRVVSFIKLSEDKNFLMDRFPIISERIYQRVFDRKEIIKDPEYLELGELLLSNSLTIFCSANNIKYYDSKFDGDHQISQGQFTYRKKIVLGYEKYFKDFKYKLINFDFTKTPLNKLYLEIINECK